MGMEKTESKTVSIETTYRPWGSFTNLYEAGGHKVKKIEVLPGARLSLQSHKHRKEHWIVVEGKALVTLDQSEKELSAGDYIFIPTGSVHRLQNIGEAKMSLIEVQLGSYLGEDDIVRYQDDYQRN
jgi:mannose-6-phosphate isomerase-like protein (cupin superfamily)